MLRGSDVAPAPSGHNWQFHCSVGVDCSNAEPCCIWLAVLRGVSSHTSPRPAAITPTRRTSSRIINHHRLPWTKSRNDGIVSSDKNRCNWLPSAEVEAMSSQGPRTIVLQKNSQGFGFTLRHFIVYPPESTLHGLKLRGTQNCYLNVKDEENGNVPGKVECQRSCLEPMDTIFVKSVKENGPAQQAGLCTGDRLVKVNGESILGKTYSQVITLIQNSENLLELTIMPKDEDVLQLVSVYSQNVNSKGGKPYSGSIKSRRSSYLLAITTERSKSCDEGLNTYRDESRVFSKLPKRVKSFFTDGSLDSLRAQEDARSKRHSTSELGTITFSDVRKEGWLHYKQILTEKGKKLGGSMRPWKRAFSVLRHHSLFLYKDKREAVLHGAGAGSSQDEHPPVNIRGCLIDIAYSETKRKHTLRLTTQDFCEYLLQAEDRDDMLAWIRVIRENSKTDEEIGQVLINKKLNDYRKHSLTGNKPDSSPRAHRMVPDFLLAKTDNTSVNRASRADDNKALWGINLMKKTKKSGCPKAFGVRLEDCQPAVNYKFVPQIVEMCCGVVEATGLEYTGIYRVPGNNAMVSSLQEHLNKGLDINTAEERWQDLNVISSLLKSFFRKLPEPLFTDDKYNDFIDANRIEDAEDRLKTMKKLIRDLPDNYYHTLKFLVGHLKRVADHSEKNKMEPRNLALVFGPTLVRTSEDNMTDMVTHMPDRYKIVETLILHHDWFFCDGELDQEEKAPEDKGDIHPVPNIDHLLSNIGRPGMPGEASDSNTSDSVKLKNYSSSKKDLNARDFLPKSFISAVTRKRKKCLSTHLPVSSGDEDSEHELVKNTGCTEGDGGGTQGPVQGEHMCSKKEKRQGGEHMVTSGEGKGGEEEEKAVKKGADREIRKRSTFLCSPQQSHATYPKPPAAISPASHVKIQSEAKERPSIPFWISPSRPPTLQTSVCLGSQQPDQSQAVPLRCRASRGGRTRATSINLELELGWCEEKVRGQRADRVEVIRAAQCGYIHQGAVVDAGSAPQIDPLPTFSSPSGWIDRSSQTSSSVVLRSSRDSQAKTRAWRRHTVVI
ncbi:rho GTPase-activating protein 23-like isoform 10-T10 [Anableps anableps]